MDRENIMLSEISQSEKDNTYDFTHIRTLMNKLSQQNRDRLVKSRLTALEDGGWWRDQAKSK